jgi:hypothetical protein
LYILAKDGLDGLQEASDPLKFELSEYMDSKKMLTDYLCIKDGVVLLVDVNLDITIDKFFRKFKEELEKKIIARIDSFFVLSSWEYGRNLKEAELVRVLSDMREIKDVFNDGNVYTVKPLNEEELKQKISQGDYEGNIYKSIFELIQTNKEEIQKAKPNVHKNSAGYSIWNVWDEEKKIFNLNRLLVGSQGTLGIATEITYKLVVDPKYTKLLVIFLRDMSIVPDLVNKI